MSGTASLSDVGALSWMTLRNVVPATAMALFVEDERQDLLAVGYAAGANAAALRGLKKTHGSGIAGWAAVNRRGVLNADPSLDLGLDSGTLEAPLRSSLTVPLAHNGRLVGVLSCYSAAAQGFTEDHLRLLELMSASLAASVASATGREAASSPRTSVGSSRKLTLVS
jgi:GAF domain-containing protein